MDLRATDHAGYLTTPLCKALLAEEILVGFPLLSALDWGWLEDSSCAFWTLTYNYAQTSRSGFS